LINIKNIDHEYNFHKRFISKIIHIKEQKMISIRFLSDFHQYQKFYQWYRTIRRFSLWHFEQTYQFYSLIFTLSEHTLFCTDHYLLKFHPLILAVAF